ncbi:LysR family transcriptional regulator [Rhodopseudomonas sp. P2A-2r]|uniref:LysR family transcriptional regulator n=1 Tax=unclassified Rhodopseudomonas TaxID=2638247 RepID=UPI0022348B96|nr:LysR family transcriptional regulator [Rhodopseudomonas sp. P2A-2r]UZE50257.1 LysR family transcriptional regulator [Rhodopseudomonas sp. P2A-2r]
MPDWEDLRHFVALAREGSLSAAARMLRVDHATVARRVAALEAETGMKLVDRRARSYALTEIGRRVAAAAAPMEDAAFAVQRAAQAAKPGLRGDVTISSPPSLTNILIAPQLIRLRQRHPAIRLTLIGEKRAASLNRREADIAVRLARPTEPGLVARKVGHFGFSLYGSPQYLKDTPPSAFTFIAYDKSMDDSPQQIWLKAVTAGRDIVLYSSDLENQIAAARSGVGLVALPHFIGDADPQLRRYAANSSTSVARDVWLIVHRDLRSAPVVRAVMEFLADCLKDLRG